MYGRPMGAFADLSDEETINDVLFNNSGDQLRPLNGHVVDAVLKPDRLAHRQKLCHRRQ